MIKVGIVGGTGYTGVELLRLLIGHPHIELSLITSRTEAGKRVDDIFPNLRGAIDLVFELPDTASISGCDVVFFATPNGIAMQQVPQILDDGTKVIDLAADFRLKDPDIWEQWYGIPHACPELLGEAVYGLPEINRALIAEARLVANPGCYPTAVVLGLLPLLAQGVVDPQCMIADAKSGVSGAGRKAQVGTLLAETSDNFKAYGVSGHRHWPEISQTLSLVVGGSVGLTFVPHLLPMIRGIHATLYATPTHANWDFQTLYEQYYASEPFVDVLPPDSHPETRGVRGSNHCRIAVHRPQSSDQVIVLSVIDNLVKGAAGQALQNMNLMFGYDETTALQIVGLMP